MFMSHSSPNMPSPNIHEVRENLADYLAAAERGDEVLICRRNQPVARLVALAPATPRQRRPIGLAADAGQALPDAFWDPLPEELCAALAGQFQPAPGALR
jgi:prevent-host-death family protein